MMRPALRCCACSLLALAAFAQPAPPDPATVMKTLDRQLAPLGITWLHSADPRTQAWGAYTALRYHLTEAIPDLLAMLANYPSPQTNRDQHDAMLQVLDALIQFRAQVQVTDAQRIYPEFPVQSLILLARSQEDATPALLAIFKDEPRWPAAWLAAGALLMKNHAEGFAAAVIEGMTVHAELTVTEPHVGYGRGGSATCCGGSAPQPKAGWPPAGIYSFAGCGDRAEPGSMVLAVGADPAYYNRLVNDSYAMDGAPCACNPDKDLVRQHYLTALLSDSPENPPVRAHVSHTIMWQGMDAYRRELAAFITQQQHVLAELMHRLGEHGLLSNDQAQSLRPKLEIRIWDQRALQSPPLPLPATQDENITVERF
jgi:hypothetical protein